MPLLHLPNELLLLIAQKLDFAKDIASLILTNRHLSSLITPYLHNKATESKSGLGALHWATAKGHRGLIRLLVQKKNFDINALDDILGQSPLHHATNRHTSIKVRKLLVELGANVKRKATDGREPLHLAASIGCDETIKLLVEKGACINSLDGRGQSVLLIAAYSCHPPIIRFLLKNGADVNVLDRYGCSALHAAVFGSPYRTKDTVIRLLLENGIDTSVRSASGYTARDYAVHRKLHKVVELLDQYKESTDQA